MKVNLDITKRQHYVWRNYLKPWTVKEDIIACYLKNINEIKTSNLMNFAQKRYFYKFNSINEKEKKFLDYLLEKTDGPIKDIVSDLLNDMYLFNELKEINSQVNELTKTSVPNKAFDSLEKNGFEQLHTHFEKEGFELISCRSLDDLKKFESNDFKYKSLFYLSVQYFRTKKMRDSAIESFKSDDFDVESIYSIVAIILALKITQNIAFDPKINYTLIEIKNEKTFIVGDQPILNFHSDKIDKNGNTIDLSFYYPLSPKHILRIDFDSQKAKYNLVNPSEEEVDFYNNKMLDESQLFVFADNEHTLKNYT